MCTCGGSNPVTDEILIVFWIRWGIRVVSCREDKHQIVDFIGYIRREQVPTRHEKEIGDRLPTN
jgi:hypothetical protein